jgi:hypothetical protein
LLPGEAAKDGLDLDASINQAGAATYGASGKACMRTMKHRRPN